MIQTEFINISKGQYLKEVLPQIPTNVILNKVITGCGATTLEIESQRHSIIIEPNVPVILGKKIKHPEICAVYEKTTVSDVEKYLTDKISGGYAKIVTTPEGFKSKVLPAIDRNRVFTRKKFFLLFDECEKIVQDVDFRDNICLPIDDFFDFENKAMVSATPIIPSDPRFEEQGFKMVQIRPDYDYKKEIRLCVTNRPRAALNQMIRSEQIKGNRKKLCIFLNSITTIKSIISGLKIKENSKIFCSSNSFDKLKDGFLYDDKVSELKEFNFFTSRFFSAVDIEIEEKPYIIIYTDTKNSSTLIDPRTASAQICGRFRNGVRHIDHITNIDEELRHYSETTVKNTLQAEEDYYFAVRAIPLPDKINITHEREKALNALRYHNFVTDKGDRNYFMWDNECYEHKVRKTFTHTDFLKSAYNTHFKPKLLVKSKMSEDEHLNSPDSWKIALENLDLHQGTPQKLQSYKLQLKSLGLDFITEAHSVFGTDKIREMGFDYKKIEAAIKGHKEKQLLASPEVKDAIYSKYNVGDVVAISEIRDFISDLYKRYQIKLPNGRTRIDKTIVSIFFEIEEKRIGKDRTRAYELTKRLL